MNTGGSLDEKKNLRAHRFAKSNLSQTNQEPSISQPDVDQSAEEDTQATVVEVVADESSKMDENLEDEME